MKPPLLIHHKISCMLTSGQRETIQKLYKTHSKAAIAREIGVHRSTVKRELDRNSVDGEYQGHMAHIYTLARKRSAGKAFNFPPLRSRWHIRKTLKRIKRPMIKCRRIRTSWREIFYLPPEQLVRGYRRGKEFRRLRELRYPKRSRDYMAYKRWYSKKIRVRYYAREELRREFMERMFGKRRYPSYSLIDSYRSARLRRRITHFRQKNIRGTYAERTKHSLLEIRKICAIAGIPSIPPKKRKYYGRKIYRDYSKYIRQAGKKRGPYAEKAIGALEKSIIKAAIEMHTEKRALKKRTSDLLRNKPNITVKQRPPKERKPLRSKPAGLAAEYYREKLTEQENYSRIFVPPEG